MQIICSSIQRIVNGAALALQQFYHDDQTEVNIESAV